MSFPETPSTGESASDAAGASALSILVDQHRRFLAYLVPRVRAREDAEEILQTAFVKTITKEGEFAKESAVAWFYSVLRNALTDYYRRQNVERCALDHARDEAEALGEAWHAELERTVCACVNGLIPTLKSEYGELVRRVDLEGASIATVAAEVGITPNNASVRIHRARLALKARLEETCRTCATHGCLDCTCKK